jgi:hypothetical protein
MQFKNENNKVENMCNDEKQMGEAGMKSGYEKEHLGKFLHTPILRRIASTITLRLEL